jgi:type IV pilus assembly protein PilQ
MWLILSSQAQQEVRPEITYIGVESAGGITEIEIKSSAPFTYTISRPADPYKITIDLQDTDLGKFQEKIVIDRAGVLEITPLRDESMPGNARIKIALTVPADIEPVFGENSLILSFDNPEAEDVPEAEEMAEIEDVPEAEEMAEIEDVPEAEEIAEAEVIPDEEGPIEDIFNEIIPEAQETEDEVLTIGDRKYVGEKISIDFQDAELVHVFRLIADISGYNIVVSPDVKGKFSMRLLDVPWDQALDVILRNYGLSKSIEGNIIRIAPTSVLSKEEEQIAKVKESQEKAGDLLTRIYPINYADVEAVKKAIDDAKILTKRGFISVDSRTTSVIIKDVERKHTEYENLIMALDIVTPQVSIDARIVEVTKNFTKELGIQWGAFVQPTSQTRIGGTTLSGGEGGFSGNPLLVNLPAAVGAGSGGSIGIGYLSSNALTALDIQLSAMESSGKGKVVSNPRIITMDNQEATIRQGKKIPYLSTSDEGTSTQFVDAALELIVTPHITPEGTILMDLEVNKNEADFSQTSGLDKAPTINTNEVLTQVLIQDGDTLALGGIFKTTATVSKQFVPGLGEIPVLKWIFGKEENVETVTEILIFITPRIVK